MNGLTIVAKEEEKKPWQQKLLGILACIFMLTGFIKTLFSGFPSLEGTWWMYAMAAAVLAVCLSVVYESRYGKWILLGGMIIAFLTMLFSMSDCINGICVLANDGLSYLTGRFGKVYLDFPVQGETGKYLAAGLAAGLLVLTFCWFVYRNQFFAGYLLTGICVMGYQGALFTVDAGLVLIVVGMIFLILQRFDETAGLKSFLLKISGILLILTVCALPLLAAGAKLDFQLKFQHGVQSVKHAMHRMQYDAGKNAMPEGNLMNLGGFEKCEEIALVIQVETPQKFYLRGMTGEIYTGSSWESFDAEVYQKAEDLFYWLHKSGFYGQTSIGESMKVGKKEPEMQSLEITNLTACKEQTYLPYALADGAPLEADLIGGDRTKSQETTVTLSYFPGSIPQWYQTAVWLAQNQENRDVVNYLQKEESYRAFVYENNLQLTNTAVGVFERMFADENKEEKTLSEILELIRTALEETLVYDEKAVTDNGKSDFLKYTFEQPKRGYSVHYATAATLMLRYFGVPSRYVEGYYLSAEEASGYEKNETINLTEAHAHAWTEYYMDGIGWMPFEVTPGYIDQEEWDELSMVVADGMGDGVGHGYAQSQLTYKPPKMPERDTNLPDLKSAFRFEVRHLVNLLILLLALALLAAVCWIIRRFVRFKQFFKQVNRTENREAVVEYYAYVTMLIEKFQIVPEWGLEEAKQLNEKARFSLLEISEEQRMMMENYTKHMRDCCKKQNGFWKTIKYRYVMWLY